MELNIDEKVRELEIKIDKIYVSVEKTRKYFFWNMVVTLVLFILPLVGLIFVIPSFISSYTNTLSTLGQ